MAPPRVALSESELQWIIDKNYHLEPAQAAHKLSEELGAPISQDQIERDLKKGDSALSQGLAVQAVASWIEQQNSQQQILSQQLVAQQENTRLLRDTNRAAPEALQRLDNTINQQQLLLNQNRELLKQAEMQSQLIQLQQQKLTQMLAQRTTILKSISDIRVNQRNEFNAYIDAAGLSPKFHLTPQLQDKLEIAQYKLRQEYLLNDRVIETPMFLYKQRQLMLRVLTEDNQHPLSKEDISQLYGQRKNLNKIYTKQQKIMGKMFNELGARDKEIRSVETKISGLEKELAKTQKTIADNNNLFNTLRRQAQSQAPSLENDRQLNMGGRKS